MKYVTESEMKEIILEDPDKKSPPPTREVLLKTAAELDGFYGATAAASNNRQIRVLEVTAHRLQPGETVHLPAKKAAAPPTA